MANLPRAVKDTMGVADEGTAKAIGHTRQALAKGTTASNDSESSIDSASSIDSESSGGR
jgi:hypothetical protein